jgi:predicted nucleotidyltransferase component of viral defense system
MTAPLANHAASVRQRLLNLAKERDEDFEQILVRYALERLLYRLSLSSHRERFVLKGALLFRLWFDLEQRPTRDADFLGFGDADPATLAKIFGEVAAIDVGPSDGLHFDATRVKAEEIRNESGYPGVRVSLRAELAKARIPVQCDIGFGDAVTPSPVLATYPTLLDMPPPELRVYPLETVVAEKLEAVVRFGVFNSRLKDYFDLWILKRYERLDKPVVVAAIGATFQRRGTTLPSATPVGLTDDFVHRNQASWQAFLRRSNLVAPELAVVVAELRDYCTNLLEAALAEQQ